MREAIEEKVPLSKIYEVLLQSYLFLGYPRALEGIKIFRETSAENEPAPSRINFKYNYWSEWKIRGRVLCEKVYGKNYDKLRDRIGEISPELSEWMIVEGYGKVLSRGVLAGVMRELCTVAALTVSSDLNQLHSHMRGARNLGAGINDIEQTVEIASAFCSKSKGQRARKLFESVFQE